MISIFTPVYNRTKIIGQLYQSLLCQTSYEFEWIIVDDGSIDNVKQVVDSWIRNTTKFEIRFYQQKNGGKHRAINYGVKVAKYDAFSIEMNLPPVDVVIIALYENADAVGRIVENKLPNTEIVFVRDIVPELW